MFAEPITLTGATNSVNDTLTMNRTFIQGGNSSWVASDASGNYRCTMEIRHTKPSKPKGSTLPVYRSNLVLKLEKFDSTSDRWDPVQVSFTLTSPGLGGTINNSDIEDVWSYLKNFLTSANMLKFVRQEL